MGKHAQKTILLVGLLALWAAAIRFSWAPSQPSLAWVLTGGSHRFREIPLDSGYYLPNRTAGHLHRPHASLSVDWQEHPDGSIRMVTNNLGLREDVDTPIAKPPGTYRILVTGDSHTDGVVPNAESFANRLEALLLAADPERSVEVLNGGTGYYGPYNYAGFLRRFLDLAPDLFVIIVYTGNDFADGLRTAELRGEISLPQRPEGYAEALKGASEPYGALAQALNQIYFFKTFPELRERSVEIASRQLLEVAEVCPRHHIELLVVTLPTRCDLPESPGSTAWRRAAERLGLGAADLGSNRELGLHLLARLRSAGIRTLDPFEQMLAADEPLFWDADLHLNHNGHDLLARAAREPVRRLISEASEAGHLASREDAAAFAGGAAERP